jgi:hypothetical protein
MVLPPLDPIIHRAPDLCRLAGPNVSVLFHLVRHWNVTCCLIGCGTVLFCQVLCGRCQRPAGRRNSRRRRPAWTGEWARKTALCEGTQRTRAVSGKKPRTVGRAAASATFSSVKRNARDRAAGAMKGALQL